jgi:hypothetical protein
MSRSCEAEGVRKFPEDFFLEGHVLGLLHHHAEPLLRDPLTPSNAGLVNLQSKVTYNVTNVCLRVCGRKGGGGGGYVSLPKDLVVGKVKMSPCPMMM